MSTHWKIIRNLLGSLKPPRFDIVDEIWTVLFEKELWKAKPPLKAPKKSRDFWKFLRLVEPNRVELFSREYLNYSNITWKRSLILKTRCVLKIFSKPRRVKNSPATGVTHSAVQIACVWFHAWPSNCIHMCPCKLVDLTVPVNHLGVDIWVSTSVLCAWLIDVALLHVAHTFFVLTTGWR